MRVNPQVFSGDSSDNFSFKKQALQLAEYVDFVEVFTLLENAPVNDINLATQQIRDFGYTEDKLDLDPKAHQNLSSLKTKVNLNMLIQVPFPAEAWLKLE